MGREERSKGRREVCAVIHLKEKAGRRENGYESTTVSFQDFKEGWQEA